MPPKIRITRQTITDAAFTLVRQRGTDALNARELARQAGCSTQPIFSTFHSMEEVLETVQGRAAELLQTYLERYGSREDNPLFQLAFAYYYFAKEEGSLFTMLFLNGDRNLICERMTAEATVQRISEDSGLDMDYAAALCRNFFFYIHGISSGMLQNADAPVPPEGELRQCLKDFYKSYRKLYKKKAES